MSNWFKIVISYVFFFMALVFMIFIIEYLTSPSKNKPGDDEYGIIIRLETDEIYDPETGEYEFVNYLVLKDDFLYISSSIPEYEYEDMTLDEKRKWLNKALNEILEQLRPKQPEIANYIEQKREKIIEKLLDPYSPRIIIPYSRANM